MTQVTAEIARELFRYDAETGVLYRVKGKYVTQPTPCGTRNEKGYLQAYIGNKVYLVHRLIWLIVTGEWPDLIDHANGTKDDNRWTNLRSVTPKVNAQNKRRPEIGNKAGLMGVVKLNRTLKKPYRATLVVDGQTMYLGMFATAEAAHAAYVEAKRTHHEGCTI